MLAFIYGLKERLSERPQMNGTEIKGPRGLSIWSPLPDIRSGLAMAGGGRQRGTLHYGAGG